MRKWDRVKWVWHLGEWNCLRESERHCSFFLVGRNMSFTQKCISYKLRLVGCFTSCLPSLARVCFWCQASHVDRNFQKTIHVRDEETVQHAALIFFGHEQIASWAMKKSDEVPSSCRNKASLLRKIYWKVLPWPFLLTRSLSIFDNAKGVVMKAILAALALLVFQAWHSHSGVSRPSWDFFCFGGGWVCFLKSNLEKSGRCHDDLWCFAGFF